MKPLHILILTQFFLLTSLKAQVPVGSELLGLHNVTNANISNITSPVIGSLLYDTTNSQVMFNTNGNSTGWTAAINDNLGNHTATQNIQTNGNWVSGNGTNTGMHIANNGNVGFGTASPGRQIHINNGGARIDNNVDPAYFMLHRNNTAGTALKTFIFGVNATGTNNGSFFIGDMGTSTNPIAANITQRMIIDNAGNVGINVTTPANGFRLDVGGNIQCVNLTQTSDKKLKKNIQPIAFATKNINKLNPVSYEYRSDKFPQYDFSSDLQFGLIAQEVEKIFPELVSDNGNEYKSINYVELIPILIKSIQERQEQIDQQNNIIENLQKKIDKINSTLISLHKKS